MSLFWRIFLLNAAVLSVATALLLFTPATVSTPARPGEVAVVFGGLAAMLVTNAALLRFGLAPLSRLTRTMRRSTCCGPAGGWRWPATPASAR